MRGPAILSGKSGRPRAQPTRELRPTGRLSARPCRCALPAMSFRRFPSASRFGARHVGEPTSIPRPPKGTGIRWGITSHGKSEGAEYSALRSTPSMVNMRARPTGPYPPESAMIGFSAGARGRLVSACRPARNCAWPRRCRSGAGGRFSGCRPRSFPTTARSTRPCARARTAR